MAESFKASSLYRIVPPVTNKGAKKIGFGLNLSTIKTFLFSIIFAVKLKIHFGVLKATVNGNEKL